jgi:Fic family protein
MAHSFQIISNNLLDDYCKQISEKDLMSYAQLEESELSIDTFSFYTSVSAVFSSKIEGENIDLDSYVKHKRFGVEYQPNYTKKIDDLYSAYQFAKNNRLNESNILQAHAILTANILPAAKQGALRVSNMYVTTTDGKIEYVAVSPFIIKAELTKFYNDLALLLNMELTIQEVFFFAALLHLVFVKIHPFEDGNGRTARLIEKWFLAEKLGDKVWLIQSEKNYYTHHQLYYNNIRKLGLEYDELDYNKALPFLEMLATAVISI